MPASCANRGVVIETDFVILRMRAARYRDVLHFGERNGIGWSRRSGHLRGSECRSDLRHIFPQLHDFLQIDEANRVEQKTFRGTVELQ